MHKDQLIREALRLPASSIAYYVSQILADMHPQKALVEGSDGLFDIEEYASAGYCTIEQKSLVYNQVVTHYHGPEMHFPGMMQGMARLGGWLMQANIGPNVPETEQDLIDRARNAWLEVRWRETTFDVIVMNWFEMRPVYYYWILTDDVEMARALLREVCRWNAEVRGEVLVFDGGCWRKDAALFQSIKGSTFDNLILKGHLKQDIRDDLQQFFAARELYEQYGVPWKRGILFVGPPGNGKTHAVKAIINALDQPCLYVKSFRADHSTDEDSISQVFKRARKSAPCILVLEDLDSLLTAQNRSFFLNELDGFAANIGIVTLATTNHPERLDPSILDRPSRFDRKYPFDLPELPERLAYISMWNGSLKPALQLTDEGITRLGEATDGFSFAYLKELFLSSMMRWIAVEGKEDAPETMQQVMETQVSTLREQMVSAITAEAETPPEPSIPGLPGFLMGRRFTTGGRA